MMEEKRIREVIRNLVDDNLEEYYGEYERITEEGLDKLLSKLHSHRTTILEELNTELTELQDKAHKDYLESKKSGGVNCYGAGYDCGQRDAYIHVLSMIEEMKKEGK